jgi:hypothetical protein
MKDEKSEYTKVAVANFPPKDFFLESLLLMCEHSGIGYPITLTVSGLVVSGNMVPTKVFFKKLSDKMKAEATYDVSNIAAKSAVEKLFEDFADIVEGGSTEKLQEAIDSGDYPEMIHLENTTIFSPSGKLAVGLWRGRVEHISGFSVVGID